MQLHIDRGRARGFGGAGASAEVLEQSDELRVVLDERTREFGDDLEELGRGRRGRQCLVHAELEEPLLPGTARIGLVIDADHAHTPPPQRCDEAMAEKRGDIVDEQDVVTLRERIIW